MGVTFIAGRSLQDGPLQILDNYLKDLTGEQHLVDSLTRLNNLDQIDFEKTDEESKCFGYKDMAKCMSVALLQSMKEESRDMTRTWCPGRWSTWSLVTLLTRRHGSGTCLMSVLLPRVPIDLLQLVNVSNQ